MINGNRGFIIFICAVVLVIALIAFSNLMRVWGAPNSDLDTLHTLETTTVGFILGAVLISPTKAPPKE